jgi:hypothetical protein
MLVHWQFPTSFSKERYAIYLDTNFGILASVLELVLIALLILNGLKNYWDIKTFIDIRKIKIFHLRFAFQFSLPAFFIIFGTNLFFDLMTNYFNLQGIIEILLFYLSIIIADKFIKNKKLLTYFSIMLGLGYRFMIM